MARLRTDGERNEVLRGFALDEGILRHYTDPDAAEGLWRARVELRAHLRWAEERHQFILAEIARTHPALRVYALSDGPPVMSHRGRTSDTSVFGETRG